MVKPGISIVAAALASASETALAQDAPDGAKRSDVEAAVAALENAPEQPSPESRAMPSPINSPPFPSGDWVGPTIGAPYSVPDFALMRALKGTATGEWLQRNRIFVYGWINVGGNVSSSSDSNSPASYDLVANNVVLDQAVLRVERPVDTVQTDHVDWGFRTSNLFGTDYRYTVAKGFFDKALLDENKLYGWDCPELYGQVYLPTIGEGTVVTFGRFISPPDIEAQLAPQNYIYTHSQMFTVDPYTFFGAIAATRLDKYWKIEYGAHGGNDMAPWSNSSSLNGHLMARWVSKDNDDSVWAGANSIGRGEYRNEHDNLQQVVGTWGHRFNATVHTMTEAYYMWQFDALKGGSVSDGPVRHFGGGGGPGEELPGRSDAFGIVNYFEVQLSDKDYLTIRNDYLADWQGQRTGYRNRYTLHTVGWSHAFSDSVQIRPEISYERAYDERAFDLGTKRDQFVFAVDLIVRF
jgi:hypothetical protein